MDWKLVPQTHLENHPWETYKLSFQLTKAAFDFLVYHGQDIYNVHCSRRWYRLSRETGSDSLWIRQCVSTSVGLEFKTNNISSERREMWGAVRRGKATWRPLSHSLHRPPAPPCILLSGESSCCFPASCETESFTSGNDHVHGANSTRKKKK